MKKILNFLLLIVLFISLMGNCKKDDNKDDENMVLLLLLLAQQQSAAAAATNSLVATQPAAGSTAYGTCEITSGGTPACVYNYLEGSCYLLKSNAGYSVNWYAGKTDSSACTTLGYTNTCKSTTLSGITYTQCFKNVKESKQEEVSRAIRSVN
ncbi:MAG: hypothetical protein H7A25_11275 [Leptospiraceae bacterium]|nr:hypothetical protein [Leptospiraceae bacterium]MCP5500477.1 hypothetical protein [Leptospiraceae bacterium]